VIEHPGGGTLDVRAELPDHIAESFATLAFEVAAGDALPIETVKFADTPEGQAKLAAAAAKARRKERRGERRNRGGR